ncbi:nitroreductase family protein [bacterium]|nr:nitroreductase family protein [bacterium]
MCDGSENLFEVIAARRSIRKYKPDPVDDHALGHVLEAARLAPSANNRQDWRFVVVTDEHRRRRLATAANNQAFVAGAPVVIACCSVEPEYIMRCGMPTAPIDLAIAIDHMTLAAAALGLGSCWIGSFYPDQVREILDIPESVGVVELLTLGYPDEDPPARPRKALSEIVYYNTWGAAGTS